MGLWKRFMDHLIGEEPPEPQERIIALSRGRSWEDYPESEARGVHQAVANADIVIDVFGTVIKDRYRVAPRPATEDEIRRARTV